MKPLSLVLCLALGLTVRAVHAENAPGASTDPTLDVIPAAPADTTKDDPEKSALRPASKTRRGGFTFGLYGAMSFGTVSGYPNDLAKLGDPQYRSATSGVGSGGTLYLGGTLTDWFTFGFGLAQSSFGSSKIGTKGTAFVFHIEAFPLFTMGGGYRDVGIFTDFGTGTATILRRDDQKEFSASGSLSIAGFGAFWEPWRAGHFVAGPFALVEYQESNSMVRTFGEVGLRGAFYGGP